jgi:hypothetical protein
MERIIHYEVHDARGTRDRTFLSFFTRSLRRAIERDTGGVEVGNLDYDPLCQCQDNGGLAMHVIRTQVRYTTATVDVWSGNRNSGTKLRLLLRRQGQVWKVADVSTARVPSLARQLAAH